MFKGHYATGTVTGTGAALNVACGFIPQHVRLVNETGLVIAEWTKAMADGHAVKQISTGVISKITTNGVTPYEGSRGGDAPGFTIGADADINVASEVIHFIAVSADA